MIAIEQGREIPNAEIEELKVENENLKNENQVLNGKVETLENRLSDLEQNEPNPFSETTVIRYFLPEGAVNAKIEVRNVENKVVGSFSLSGTGHGNITLSAGTLAAGNYFYSLIINNNIIDTKKMILLN